MVLLDIVNSTPYKEGWQFRYTQMCKLATVGLGELMGCELVKI